jgi:predicted adenine nucleotide alpha hydrolase (AANH) superfamily ATPase
MTGHEDPTVSPHKEVQKLHQHAVHLTKYFQSVDFYFIDYKQNREAHYLANNFAHRRIVI